MIHGRKENGYFQTIDRDGRKIEGETRQCSHCQFVWERKFNYNRSDVANDVHDTEIIDGKKVTRGYCMKCHGFICCRSECIERYGLAPDCHTFEDDQRELLEKLEKQQAVPELGLEGGSYALTSKGIIIPN